jgi:hypothetical protein
MFLGIEYAHCHHFSVQSAYVRLKGLEPGSKTNVEISKLVLFVLVVVIVC